MFDRPTLGIVGVVVFPHRLTSTYSTVNVHRTHDGQTWLGFKMLKKTTTKKKPTSTFLKTTLVVSSSAACPHHKVPCQCLCGHTLSGSNHIQLLVLWLLSTKNVFADASLSLF